MEIAGGIANRGCHRAAFGQLCRHSAGRRQDERMDERAVADGASAAAKYQQGAAQLANKKNQIPTDALNPWPTTVLRRRITLRKARFWIRFQHIRRDTSLVFLRQ